MQAVALSTLAGSFLSAGNAAAASEVSQLAAGDGRFGAIAFLFAPVVGWVSFWPSPTIKRLHKLAAGPFRLPPHHSPPTAELTLCSAGCRCYSTSVSTQTLVSNIAPPCPA